MNCTLPLLALMLLVAAAAGEAFAAEATTKPTELKWQKLAEDSEIVKVTLPDASKEVEAIQIKLPETGGTVRVLALKDPKITQASYGIEGTVKYDNVKGNGYIEMWNHFPDGSAYFTRTLDTSGPMGMLHGKSNWREFRLPFYSEPGKTPSKLEVNIVLPGGGTVILGPPTLKDGLPAPPAAKKSAAKGAVAAWWGPSQGGRLGGILGTTLGLFGTVVGILCSRPRSRRYVPSLMIAMCIACGLLLVTGVCALLAGQPWAVWYPLVLCGGIGGVVSGAVFPAFKRRLAEEELRRMTALDA